MDCDTVRQDLRVPNYYINHVQKRNRKNNEEELALAFCRNA